MAAPLTDAETWRVIKLSSIRGVPDSVLAKHFNVTTNSIASRRFDDDEWKAAKPKLVKPIQEQSKKGNSEAIEAVTSASLAEIGEQNSLLLAQYAARKIKNSVENDLLSDPDDWSKLKTASEILRKATGQDRDQAVVSVNLFAGGQFYDTDAPTFEAVTIETEAENGPDFC